MSRSGKKSEKVLITGGSGYVGSTLVREVLARGYEVRLLDNLIYGGRSLLGVYNHHNFEFNHCDIRDKNRVNELLGNIDFVIHLAAIVGDIPCQRRPEESVSINLDATVELFELSKKKGVKRFIFASTCSNYGISGSSQLATEESPLNPISLYAETKVDVEKYLSKNNDSDMVTVSFRFGTAYGLSARTRFDLLVNSFTYEALRAKKIVMYAPDTWRPYIHVADMSEIMIKALTLPGHLINNQIFNAGFSKENYIKRDVAQLIAEIVGDTEIVEYKEKDDLRNYRVDFKKLEKVFQFKPKKTVKDGIREIKTAFETGILTDKDYQDNKL